MQQLLTILSEFRAGRLDQAQLLTKTAALLTPRADNLDDVLNAVQQAHAAAPLPLAALVALRKHLHSASAPKTEILSAPPSFQPEVPAATPRTEPTEEVLAKQAIGAVLAGRFKLVEYVGSGGTSRLYKAVDQRKVEAGAEDPHVAVKVLTLRLKDTMEAVAVLHRETEGLQGLGHPNIVRVIDCDRDGDTVFMTMEFIRGKTLHQLMRASRYAEASREETLGIVQSVAKAVGFAHSKFIIHGDLTPGNVMIATSGAVKVIDFGISRIFGQPAVTGQVSRSGARGELAGYSPLYASPEMIELREPDPRDDIYALACLTWELFTGKHPFNRRSSKVARDEGAKLEYTEKLSRLEFAALSRAMSFARDQRTPTVREFIDDLIATKPDRRPIFAGVAAAIVAIAAGAYFFLNSAPSVQPSTAPVQSTASTPLVPTAETVTGEVPAVAEPALAPGAIFRDCPTCPLMTVVPAGEFMQGSAEGASNALPSEFPQHRVSIAAEFSASRTEVTVGEYAEFAQETKRERPGCSTYDGQWKVRPDVQWKNAVARQTPSHPVSCVSWSDATEYAQWLSEKTGKKYRLPSASEWEYVSRAGSTADRGWSTEAEACAIGNVADRSASQRYPGWTAFNCDDANVQTAPVGSYAANGFGLQDSLGNVFEWVADCWNESYAGAPTDGSARQDGDCSQHEMRGGSWFTAPALLRFSYRNRFETEYRSASVGFRIVRQATP